MHFCAVEVSWIATEIGIQKVEFKTSKTRLLLFRGGVLIEFKSGIFTGYSCAIQRLKLDFSPRWHLDDIWMISGWFLDDFWMISGWYLGNIWMMKKWSLLSLSLGVVENVIWTMCGSYLDDMWLISGWYVGDIWMKPNSVKTGIQKV